MNRKIFFLVRLMLITGLFTAIMTSAQNYEGYGDSNSDQGNTETIQSPADESDPSETSPADQYEEPSTTEPAQSTPDLNSGTENSSTSSQEYGTSGSQLFASSSANGESGFQNAIIEGVQLTAEQGSLPDEKIIAGYFIFRDKPSSYFYEIKLREKKLVFEFNDTRVGASPVPTASEPPIKGFVIEQGKIDVNKAVKGLKPEWHDIIRVIFDLEAVPDVHVNDEYSIISFSFKWSSDPEKQAKYIVKDQTPKIFLWSTAGVGGIALGAVAYLFLRPEPKSEPLGQLPVDDLPKHDDNFPVSRP